MSVFVHAGGGVKNGKNSVHVVVEWPPKAMELQGSVS